MAPIAVGDSIPEGSCEFFDQQDNLKSLNIHYLCQKKKVVIIGVPGAFTHTCSFQHVPDYIEKAELLKSKGVDEILCISVNDAFVIREWQKTFTKNKYIKFLADGSGKYIKALGLELDMTAKGFGMRSRRFALLVEDLKVKVANIEEAGKFTVSGANEILKAL